MKILIVIICFILIPAVGLIAGGEAEKWDYWDASDSTDDRRVDHSLWQEFLEDYLVTESSDGINLLDYASALSSGASRLEEYIIMLEAVEIRNYNSDEQFAFWVNLYNAATVRLILDNYPISSIRRISNPWGRKLVRIEGQQLSLDDIEHRILRPIWQEPRIHFAVNCASLGCPNLPAQALSSSNSDEVLENAARDFINHPRGVKLNGDLLILSSIFSWYLEDFGLNEEELLVYLGRYSKLDLREKRSVKYEYNWALNEINR